MFFMYKKPITLSTGDSVSTWLSFFSFNNPDLFLKMIELLLLGILIFIGILWFRNLNDNSVKEENPEVDRLRKEQSNKWSVYLSILIVSGFFVWLLITNGNLN